MRKLKLDELNRLSLEEYSKTEKIPVSILLDNIRSMHNIGSCFRTGDAFAIEHLYLSGISATPPHRDIHKTALGATDNVAWSYSESPRDIILPLKKAGYQIISVEQTDDSYKLSDFPIDRNSKYLLIFGNEVDGVSDESIKHSDISIEIEQFGTKHSLNISVSVGILLFSFSKILRK